MKRFAERGYLALAVTEQPRLCFIAYLSFGIRRDRVCRKGVRMALNH